MSCRTPPPDRAQVLAALADPAAWVLTTWSRIRLMFARDPMFSNALRTVRIRHASGYTLHVLEGYGTWTIEQRVDDAEAQEIAVLDRSNGPASPGLFLHDLERATGPSATQRLHRLLLQIRLDGANAGLHGRAVLWTLFPSTMQSMMNSLMGADDTWNVPESVRLEMEACRHVRVLSPCGTRLIAPREIEIHFPSTRHDILDVMHQIQNVATPA